MAGGTIEHGALALAVTGELRAALRGKPCRAFSSDVRVRIPETDLATYPDLSIVCGQLETAPDDKDAITNPIVLVEVLSDSTEPTTGGRRRPTTGASRRSASTCSSHRGSPARSAPAVAGRRVGAPRGPPGRDDRARVPGCPARRRRRLRMKFLPTDLPGVILIEPDVFKDARGFFLETYHERKYARGRDPAALRPGQPLALGPGHAARPARPAAQAPGQARPRGGGRDVRRRGGHPPRLAHLREVGRLRALRRELPPALDPARLRPRLLRHERARARRVQVHRLLRPRRRAGGRLERPRHRHRLADRDARPSRRRTPPPPASPTSSTACRPWPAEPALPVARAIQVQIQRLARPRWCNAYRQRLLSQSRSADPRGRGGAMCDRIRVLAGVLGARSPCLSAACGGGGGGAGPTTPTVDPGCRRRLPRRWWLRGTAFPWKPGSPGECPSRRPAREPRGDRGLDVRGQRRRRAAHPRRLLLRPAIAKQCTILAFSVSTTAKPEKIRTDSAAAGTYTLFVENTGPATRDVSFQVVLTPTTASALAALGLRRGAQAMPLGQKRPLQGHVTLR